MSFDAQRDPPMPPSRSPTLRVDLHSHTRYSYDAVTTPARLVARARAASIDRIAVTDHGVLAGALEAHQLDPERVIVGLEIRCRGVVDLIGLFLEELVPDGLEPAEAARRIRAQGGIVYAPHPYAYPVGTEARAQAVLAVADVVEIVNSRAFVPRWNRRAREAADRLGLPGAAGSDAHFPLEIGRCWSEMPAFDGPRDFVEAAAAGSVRLRRRASPLLPAASMAIEIVRRLGGGRRVEQRGAPSVS